MAVVTLLLILVGMAKLAGHYHNKALAAESATKQAVAEKNQAEAITGNVITAVNLFNDIAGATLNDQQANSLDSQAAQADISTALADDACAAVVVPAGANNRVLDRYNAVRKSASNTDTSQSANAVPAITATR
ncbi:hypothetical protein [Erwinia typographi]|uniref:hypothetical protein n=1 Tax=Erwinia typographi TaxID=371042 RepID=UPI000B2ECCD0|nr:hypothetical protein [Erwinia typographi]